jgi:high-affinity nickel-transport protein
MCGLWFSLGHSTIVIIVVGLKTMLLWAASLSAEQNIAVAIGSHVLQKMQHVGDIGGIVGKLLDANFMCWLTVTQGTAVSGSFLFVVGLANTIILIKIIRRRRLVSSAILRTSQRHWVKRRLQIAAGLQNEAQPNEKHGMLMTRMLGPVINFVDRPYKVCYVDMSVCTN